MTNKRSPQRRTLRLTFRRGLYLSLIATFALVFCIMFVFSNNGIGIFTEHFLHNNGRMPEEKEMLQIQLELLKCPLNQVDTVLRQERDSLQAQLERLRTTLEQERERQEENKKRDVHDLRQERDGLQMQLEQLRTSLKQERERQEENKRLDVHDLQPILVTIAHQPRYDLLGSFVAPTLLLLAIAVWNGWALEILPYAGSLGEQTVKRKFALGHNISKSWGSGFIDASNRKDFDPAKINAVAYDNLGFFPEMPDPAPTNTSEWIRVDANSGIPKPGLELVEICKTKNVVGNGFLRCRLWFPPDLGSPSEVTLLKMHMAQNGGPDIFFNAFFRLAIRERYWAKNAHRLKHYGLPKEAQNISMSFNVAIHVRRGDILDPNRWIDQSVYATVARRICQAHPGEADIHIFSSGKNRDGNWSVLEEVGSTDDECRSIAFHLDEDEFDTWAHMVAADVFVMGKSTFSLIPAMLSAGEIHCPKYYGSASLSHWHRFDEKDGAVIPSFSGWPQ